MKTRNPTFELLREKRVLAVLNPATGTRFAISLRDWQGTLWAVRVHPREKCAVDRKNPFVTAHRMMSRPAIEEWLGRLLLSANRSNGF
jgi:hypothetical protein